MATCLELHLCIGSTYCMIRSSTSDFGLRRTESNQQGWRSGRFAVTCKRGQSCSGVSQSWTSMMGSNEAAARSEFLSGFDHRPFAQGSVQTYGQRRAGGCAAARLLNLRLVAFASASGHSVMLLLACAAGQFVRGLQ